MVLPDIIKSKYLARLEGLIQKGQEIPIRTESVGRLANYVTGEMSYRQVENIDWAKFVEWRTMCITLLDQVIPRISVHRSTVDNFGKLENKRGHLEFGISFLKSIRDDFENGYLEELATEIESELTTDYIRHAASLLNEGSAGKYDYIAAAALSGAILEKALKTICCHLSPPEPIYNDKSVPLKLNSLIDCLKKRKVYNEIIAKQLRTWADIRNSAAHGNFDEFNKQQVEVMISGINTFLQQHL